MKVLIATRNKDKFKVTTKLLTTSIFEDGKFYSLNDLEDIKDVKEENDIVNRSKMKALNVFNNLKENIFDYIIGIDDGIMIKGKIIENVKDYLKKILYEDYLEENEIVYICKAYTFIDKDKNMISITTKIPFRYKKANYKIDLKENTYPLSHILSPLESDKSVVELDEEEDNNYYLKYSNDEFNNVLTYFNSITKLRR